MTYYKNLHKHKNNNFNIYNLDKIKTKKIKLLKNEIKDIYTDCYYFYKKREKLNLESTKFKNRKNIYLKAKSTADKMIKKIKPDIGIIHGGEFGETRSFLKSLKKKQTRLLCY